MTGNVLPGYSGNVLIPVEVRFWSKVDRRGPDECWPWLATHDSRGYGQIHVGGRKGEMVKAHRVALRLSGTDVPDGTFVLHSCDNPDCVNPAHLRVGTNADNMRDMYARGRQAPPKTHCKYGHEFTPANTITKPRQRRCRTCRNAARRVAYQAHRSAHDSFRADLGVPEPSPSTVRSHPATAAHESPRDANPQTPVRSGSRLGDLPLQPGFGS